MFCRSAGPSILAASLVSFMEKQNALLRKLKAGFNRKKKIKESRNLNRKFNIEISASHVCPRIDHIAKI